MLGKKFLFYLLGAAILLAVAYGVVHDRLAYRYQAYEKSEVMLDTLVTIRAYGDDQQGVEAAVAAALAAMREVGRETDYFDPKSEISVANRKAARGGRASVHSDLANLLSLASAYYRDTGGAFDVTIGPVARLYDFDKKRVPSPAKLREKLLLVDGSRLDIPRQRDPRLLTPADTAKLRFALRVGPGQLLDLGGVAKGYAADIGTRVLEERGIASAIVTTGSTTVILGEHPTNPLGRYVPALFGAGDRSWTIGVQHPRRPLGRLAGKIITGPGSVSTSGDYQQTFVKDGVRYHHILDPKTGLPARGFTSVTVLTRRSCAAADILSTALFVMGPANAKRWLARNEDVQAVLIDSKGRVFVTAGLREGTSARVAGLPSELTF